MDPNIAWVWLGGQLKVGFDFFETNITMENHYVWWEHPLFQWPCSMANHRGHGAQLRPQDGICGLRAVAQPGAAATPEPWRGTEGPGGGGLPTVVECTDYSH